MWHKLGPYEYQGYFGEDTLPNPIDGAFNQRFSVDWRELHFKNGERGFYYGSMHKSAALVRQRVKEKVTLCGRGILIKFRDQLMQTSMFGTLK